MPSASVQLLFDRLMALGCKYESYVEALWTLFAGMDRYRRWMPHKILDKAKSKGSGSLKKANMEPRALTWGCSVRGPHDYKGIDMTSLYKELGIWKRPDADTAVLYRCFHDLTKGCFAIQSADFFKLPIDERQVRVSEKQFLELLVEVAPSERCDWFSSIDEAIAGHEKDFS